MDPRLHLLMSLAMGAILMMDRTRDRRKWALVGALGILGLLPDSDVFLFPGADIRPFESAAFIVGVPLGLFGIASLVERGGAETLRRRFAVASLAVLFGHIIMDAAKGHTPAILYPFSPQRFEFRFGDPEIAYSGVWYALALVGLMTAAAFIANRSMLTAREAGDAKAPQVAGTPVRDRRSQRRSPRAAFSTASVPVDDPLNLRRHAIKLALARRRSSASGLG